MKNQRGLELAVSALVVNYNTDDPALLLYPRQPGKVPLTNHGPSYFSVEE